MRNAAPHGTGRFGFTLVEVLVSTFVLLVLILLVNQLVNTATRTIVGTRRHMDADSQARMVFARMGTDFSKIVNRSDVDYIFYKGNGSTATSGSNDAMFFYSEAPAYFANVTGTSTENTVALIGYRIHLDPDPDKPSRNIPQLERLGKGLTWDGSPSGQAGGGVVFLTPATGGPPAAASTIAGVWGGAASSTGTSIGTSGYGYADGNDPDYHVLGDQVYRMEIAFLLTNGTTSNYPVTNPANTTNNLTASGPPSASSDNTQQYSNGSRWYDNSAGRAYICTNATTNGAVWVPLGIKDVSAIIVAIALLDDTSREMVNYSSTTASSMISGLPDSNPPVLMAQSWLAAVQSGSAGVTSTLAASQIRIYQNYFYLNDN
jgi:prepilin-type N-terminal cleavage/methylation domain-containing protein